MSKREQIILGGAILGLALGVALASRGAAPGAEVSELKVTIREWNVPTKGAHPHDPAVGPDGALWFTEQMSNKLGRLDPATGTFKEYPLVEGKNSGPHGLVADKDGNIWYTANFAGYIGKLDPRTGKVTEYKMPDEAWMILTRLPLMPAESSGSRRKAGTPWAGSTRVQEGSN
jgi:streptogramin lyase